AGRPGADRADAQGRRLPRIHRPRVRGGRRSETVDSESPGRVEGADRVSLLVISCSLNPDSRSRMMARHALATLAERNAEAELLDLQDWPLPLCDGNAAYDDPQVATLTEKISAADGVLMAVPVYNFDVNA